MTTDKYSARGLTFLATAGGLARQGKARDWIFPIAIPEEEAAEFLAVWRNTEQHYIIVPLNESNEDTVNEVKKATHILTPANKFHADYATDKKMRRYLEQKTGWQISTVNAAHEALKFLLRLDSLSELTQTQLNRVVRACYGTED